MAQQTVVEWLVEKLEESGIPLIKDELEMIKQANQMFEKQIVKAVDSNFSYDSTEFPTLGQQYYDNTYKK